MKILFRILCIALSLLQSSCYSPDISVDRGKYIIPGLTLVQSEWVFMQQRSNSMVIKAVLTDSISNSRQVITIDSVCNEQRLTAFKKVLSASKDSGYCCCPFNEYEIIFYHDSIELGNYYIDIKESNKKVMFYDGHFQTSYYIDFKNWLAFIEKH